MKKILTIQALLLTAILLAGCGVTWSSVAYDDDLYEVHDKDKIADNRLRAMSKREAAKSQYDSRLAQTNAFVDSFESVLADDYESAYARRLFGFSSPTYRMPSSYYTYRYSDAFRYASAYDPAFYNVMVSGDMVWVEPKYITSMFGTWGASVMPTYSWYYGWGNPYAGTWWGSPYHYPWSSYWYSGIYNPYFYWGYPYYPYYYYHYYPHYHHHYPPHHGGVGNTGYNPNRGRVYRNTNAPAPAARGGSSYRGGKTTYQSTPSSGSSYRSGNSSSSSSRSGGSTYRSSGSRGSSTYRSTPSYPSGGGGSSYRGGSTHGR